MTQRATYHQFPQPLANGLYIAEGTEDDHGQTLSNPVFWQDEVAAKPADFDTVPYQINLDRTWENHSADAQAAKAAKAEADAKAAQDTANAAQAQAKAVSAKYMKLMLASAKASDDTSAATTETATAATTEEGAK